MFLKPSASFPTPLPSWCIEYYRWKATVQVSLVSIVSPGPQRALPAASAQRQARQHCRTNVLSLLKAWPKPCRGLYFFFFCIEICRSPSRHVCSPVGLGEAGGLRGSRSSSAPEPSRACWGASCAPHAPHLHLLLWLWLWKNWLPSFPVLIPYRYEGLKSIGKKKSPVLIWCSKDLLEVNPNSSVNLLLLSNSLYNIAGIREFYDFLKTLHKYQQHNFI